MESLAALRSHLVGEYELICRASARDEERRNEANSWYRSQARTPHPHSRSVRNHGRARRPTSRLVRVARMFRSPSRREQRRNLFRSVFVESQKLPSGDDIRKFAEAAVQQHEVLLHVAEQGGGLVLDQGYSGALDRLLYYLPPSSEAEGQLQDAKKSPEHQNDNSRKSRRSENDERDKYIYLERMKTPPTSYSAIRKHINRVNGWSNLSSDQGARKAADRYSTRHGLPPVPKES